MPAGEENRSGGGSGGLAALPAALAARPRLSALLGATCIAFSGILYRLAAVTPETASFWRSVYGMPLLVLATAIERRGGARLPRRGRALAALAGVFFAADLLFWHHAIDAVGVGLATVLANLQVVFVAVATWLLFGERPTARTIVAIPIVLAGIVLIGGVIGSGTYGADPPLGVVLGALTAVSYGSYLVIMRRVGHRSTAEPVAISTTSTAIVTAVVGLAVGRLDLFPHWPAHGWLALLGISAQSAAYLLIGLSLPRLPGAITSVILLAQPVMSVFLAIVLLGEAPSVAQLGGVGLVIGGIALATAPVAALRRRAAMLGP